MSMVRSIHLFPHIKNMNKISRSEVFWKSDAVESGLSMIYSKCDHKDGSTVFNIPALRLERSEDTTGGKE